MTIGEAVKSGVNTVSTTQLPSGDDVTKYVVIGVAIILVLLPILMCTWLKLNSD